MPHGPRPSSFTPRSPRTGASSPVSDIHGNLPFFDALLDKAAFTREDIWCWTGTCWRRGRDSLALLRRIMDLCRTHTVYPVCGQLATGWSSTSSRPTGWTGGSMPPTCPSTRSPSCGSWPGRGGFEQTEDLPRLREDLRAACPEIWAWLRALPTVLETEHLVFVHGGVPALDHMEELERWRCMKNDDFLGQGHSFSKWVVVGHWPVTLYRPDVPSAAPHDPPGPEDRPPSTGAAS